MAGYGKAERAGGPVPRGLSMSPICPCDMGPSTSLTSWGHRGPRSYTAQAWGTSGSRRQSTAPWMGSDSSWARPPPGAGDGRGRGAGGPQVVFPTVQVWATQHEACGHFSGFSCEKGHSGRTLAGPIGSQAPSWGMSTLHLASGARGSPLQAERLCASCNSAE